MKVCRMCWTLLDDQFNGCLCIQGATPAFFKDISEMINHFVTHERLMSKRARKLEELVKGRIKEIAHHFEGVNMDNYARIEIESLQSLLDESQNTNKEEGKAI